MNFSSGLHSIFFAFFVLLLSWDKIFGGTSSYSNFETFINLFCLFLILTIGISHGALDNLKGIRLLKSYGGTNQLIFYLSYIFVSIFVIFLWIFIPSITLILFLIVASYHFGKEDSVLHDPEEKIFLKYKFSSFKFFIKGSIIVLAPLVFHFKETINIFEILLVENNNLKNILIFLDKNYILHFFLAISIMGGLYKNDANIFFPTLIEIISILVLNFVLSPLPAFTVYFCFLHSIRHATTLANELDKNNFSNGFKKFINKALPLTIVTAILFLLSLIILKNYYEINDAILKVIFIGLASLTFPHILLEYLIEKNEK